MSEQVEIIIDEPTIESTPRSGKEEFNQADLDQIPPIEMKDEFMNFSGGEDLLSIKLTSYGARLEDPNNPAYFKHVSLKSLARAIMDEESVDTSFLPLYGLDYIGIRRYMQFANKHFVFIEACAAKRTILYHRNSDEVDNYNIPHPTLLMAVKLTEQTDGTFKVSLTKLFAMKTPLFTDDTQLYKYPYGNVWVNDHGRICWGNYEREVMNARYQNILQCGGLMNTFINTGYNDDLFYSEVTPYKSGFRFRDVYRFMESKTDYPYETLEPSLKFSELLSLLKNN